MEAAIARNDHRPNPWHDPAAEPVPPPGSGQVPAAERALAIVWFLARQPRPVTAAAIARELDIPRSSLYHLLAALEQQGFVAHISERRRYALGIAAFEIGSAFQRQAGLERLARPLLADLARRIGHTCHLGILDGREVLYLVKESPTTPDDLITEVGVRLPAHLTASGRAMLAGQQPSHVIARLGRAPNLGRRTARGPLSYHQLAGVLRTDRQRGWSEEDGEVTEGYASVGAVVRAHLGTPAAAISATFPSDALGPAARAALAEQVGAVADTLTGRLGGWRPRLAVR